MGSEMCIRDRLNTVAHGFSGIRADSIRACLCDCARHACTALVTAQPALLGMRENRSGLSSRPPRHWLVDASLNTVVHGFSGMRADLIRACLSDCARQACTAVVTAHIALLGMCENKSGLSSRPTLHWRLATSHTTVVHGFSGMRADPIRACPVSYTHLTLPTIYSV